jgi:hypothetical protein
MVDARDWFQNTEGDVTHWCGGIPTNKEVIDRYHKTGVIGNIKHEQTNTELSKWFYPAPLNEDQARVEAGLDPQYICSACGKTSPDLTKPITVGDPDESI